ncbi:unnamed protein product [Gadus morhua 'NCC']
MSFMETWRWEFKSKLQQTGALLKCLSTLPPSPNRDLSTSLWRKIWSMAPGPMERNLIRGLNKVGQQKATAPQVGR